MAKKISDKLTFSFGWLALKLMGKSLYSNAWSAISELVANGFDANADTIWVMVDISNKAKSVIEIFDNGDGMSYDDMRTYTQVGFNKREAYKQQHKTKTAPPTIMGRKGIGKLAALYLSSHYFILNKPLGGADSAWEMKFQETPDNPNEAPALQLCSRIPSLCCKKFWDGIQHGTMLKLVDVDLSGAGEKALQALSAKLANYFSLGTMNAKRILLAIVNQKERIKFLPVVKKVAFKNMSFIEYSPDDSKSQKEFLEGFSKGEPQEIPYIKIDGAYKHRIEVGEWTSSKLPHVYSGVALDGSRISIPYKLTGWIGIHCTINKNVGAHNDNDFMSSQFYNPSQLRLYVRNKLAVENFLNVINNTQTYINYIEGEIHFDLLDDDNLPDIATSNRQNVDENDPRVDLLVQLVKPIIRSLINRRTELAAKIREESRRIKDERDKLAKDAFSQEVRDELRQIKGLSLQRQSDLTTILTNKVKGDVELKNDRVIFFSHSSHDKLFADFFYELLLARGVKKAEMFYTSRDDDPESYADIRPLSDQIVNCIRKDNTLLFYLIGYKYNDSQFCLFEGGAGWATRAVGTYPVLAVKYKHIPKFLTNGKDEMSLYDRKTKSIELGRKNYQIIVTILNRLIRHINYGRRVKQIPEVPEFENSVLPKKVMLLRLRKNVRDFMDKQIVEYWDAYVTSEIKKYLRDMRKMGA